MSGGNGHKPINVGRGLLPLIRSKRPLPRGPFTGALLARALEDQGWVPENTAADEWMVWRHPLHAGLVTMNPYWEAIWEGDKVFRTVARDMGLGADELVTLLQSLR